MHIGGMSHYLSHVLSPPEMHAAPAADGEATDLGLPWPPARLEVAHHAADLLRALSHDEPPPGPPPGIDADLAARLERVRAAVCGLFAADGSGPRSA
jgi:hypothetical protein